MSMFKQLRKIFVAGLLSAAAISAHAVPGCYGKMWNPIADLDFKLIGGVKVAGGTMMETPRELGAPPKHNAKATCFCTNGLQTGLGLGLTYWLPSYVNDVARQAGCLGFLDGTNILPGFISLSSGQEYADHRPGKEGVTSMQVHWAYADITAIAGKGVFEKCGNVSGGFNISYLTEPDFIFQNDVYSVVMTPQAAVLAAAPILSQMACGVEAMANTLGDWRDIGVCAWKGTRLPYSATTTSKDSAQVSNMDVTVKYLARSALLGTQLRTMGEDVTCKAKYSAFYDPFQHRYQWSYPNKTSTRYNVDVSRWGMSTDGKSGLLTSTTIGGISEAEQASLETVDTTQNNANDKILGSARKIMSAIPKPLNYPTREAGYMQVWEAKQCCLMVFTLENILQMIIENIATMGGSFYKDLYDAYNDIQKVYQVVNDPIGAVLDTIGDGIAKGLSSVGGEMGDWASGIANSALGSNSSSTSSSVL